MNYYKLINIQTNNKILKNINEKKNNFIISIIIIFMNSISFLINLFLLFEKKLFNSKKFIKFKNSDIFNIYLIKFTYKEISDFLNNKYNLKINNLNLYKKNESKLKKIIKIHCIDLFNKTKHIKWLKDKLEDKFIIKFDSNNPDYLIFNVFGNLHLNSRYKNAIKIAIFTENFIPNLTEVDYAIGHYHINYLDRYFKYSVFLWEQLNDINKIRQKVLNNPTRKNFCAALISNSRISDGLRLIFIEELNKYKIIDMGGKYKNNIGRRIKDKIKFFSTYKFSISMENTSGDGYISEKIVDSFISGTIPIYYGDYMLDEFFNPKSYILIKDLNNIKNKINYIIEIDNNEEKYKNILKENVIVDNNYIKKIDNELKLFLNNIFGQEKLKAYRLNG